MTAYNYSNTAATTTLSAAATATATSITVAAVTGLPTSYPYTLILDYQGATAEVVSVTAATGTTLTVTRGEDGTTGQAHASGATVAHAVVARDLGGPQTHMAASTGVHGVAGSVVGTTDSQTLTNKTISGGSNTLLGIPDSAISGLAASKVSGAFGSITATGTINGAVVTGVNVSGSGDVMVGSTSLPRGVVQCSVITSDLATGIGSTETTVWTSPSLSMAANRTFRVTASVNVSAPSETGQGDYLWLWRDASHVADSGLLITGVTGWWVRGHLLYSFQTGATTETHTFKVSALRASGTTTFDVKAATNHPFVFMVEDIGPSGIISSS